MRHGKRLEWLVWTSLLVAVAAVAFIAKNLSESVNREIKNEFAVYQSALAESSAKTLKLFFAEVETELRMLSTIPGIKNLEVIRADEELMDAIIKHHTLLSSIVLVDYKGEILVDPRFGLHPEELKDQIRGLFRKMLQERLNHRAAAPGERDSFSNTTISEEIVIQGNFAGFAIGVPLIKEMIDGSKVITGMIAALVSQSDLVNNLIEPVNIGENGAVFILTHTKLGLTNTANKPLVAGVVDTLSDTEKGKTFMERMLSNGHETIWLDLKNGGKFPKILNREKVLISFAPATFAGVTWSVAVLTPEREIVKHVRKSHIQSLLLASFVALILYFGAVVLIRLNRGWAAAEEKARFVAELEKKNEELERLNGMKDDFVAIVSHDLRSPLGVIRSYASLMLPDAEKTGKNLKPIKAISRSAERLLTLINDILDLAKVEAGEMKLNYQTVDVDSLIHDSFKAVQFNAESKGIGLVYDGSGEPASIRGDNNKLYQVLNNLIGNAIKFTPEKGKVTVSKSLENGNLKIEVKDTGEGLSLDEQKKVFDKFKQVGKAGEGTGLGLAICKHLVELHEGKIWIESEKGKGANFIFSIPVNEPTNEEAK